jgi:hypothetical protein
MSIRFIGPLLCGGILLAATAAFAAQGDPLPGIDVSMEQNPGGIIIAQGTTNGSGDLRIGGSFPPGTYVIRAKSGSQKGQVLKTITLTKPGPISGKVAMPASGGGAR